MKKIRKKILPLFVTMLAALTLVVMMSAVAFADTQDVGFGDKTALESEVTIQVGSSVDINCSDAVFQLINSPTYGPNGDASSEILACEKKTAFQWELKANKPGTETVRVDYMLNDAGEDGSYQKSVTLTVNVIQKQTFTLDPAGTIDSTFYMRDLVREWLNNSGKAPIINDCWALYDSVSGTYKLDLACLPLTYNDVQGPDGLFAHIYAFDSDGLKKVEGVGRSDASAYSTREDLEKEFTDEVVPADTVFYAIPKAAVSPLELTVKAPACEGKIEFNPDNPEIHTGTRPEVTVPAKANYEVATVDGIPFTRWLKAEGEFENGDTLKGGTEYIALIVLKPAFKYYIDDSCKVTVNGKDVTSITEGINNQVAITAPMTCEHISVAKITKRPTAKKTGIRTYTCSGCGEVLKTEKVKFNPMTVKAKTKTVKYSKVKKKAVTVARKNVLTVSKAKGTVTYKKVSGNKKILVNAKTGKVTVKKGLKKGTYKVKVKVRAAGNKTYADKTLTRTFKIKVK